MERTFKNFYEHFGDYIQQDFHLLLPTFNTSVRKTE
jgi:hypothetical protein